MSLNEKITKEFETHLSPVLPELSKLQREHSHSLYDKCGLLLIDCEFVWEKKSKSENLIEMSSRLDDLWQLEKIPPLKAEKDVTQEMKERIRGAIQHHYFEHSMGAWGGLLMKAAKDFRPKFVLSYMRVTFRTVDGDWFCMGVVNVVKQKGGSYEMGYAAEQSIKQNRPDDGERIIESARKGPRTYLQ